MKKINLNIICPKRNEIHYQCLREVIIYFDFYLNKMGFEVKFAEHLRICNDFVIPVE